MTDQGAIESIAKAHAAHVVYYGTPEAKCVCGWKGEDGDVHLAKVSLDALAADGYSVVKAGGWQHSVTEPLEPDRLPRPMSLDLCRRRIAARREIVERDGADPSSMPILLRRPLLVQLPWEPVPEGSEGGEAR